MESVARVFAQNRFIDSKRQSVSAHVVGLHLDERERLLVGLDVVDGTDEAASQACAVFAMDLAAKKVECLFDGPRRAYAYRYDRERDAHVLLHLDGITEVVGGKERVTEISVPNASKYDNPLASLAVGDGGAVFVGGNEGSLFTVRDGVVGRVAMPEGLERWSIEAIVSEGDALVIGNVGGDVLAGRPGALEVVATREAAETNGVLTLLRRADGKLLVGGRSTGGIAGYELEGSKVTDAVGVRYLGDLHAVAEHDGREVWAMYNMSDRVRVLTRDPKGGALTAWCDAPAQYVRRRNEFRIQALAHGGRLLFAHGANIHLFEGGKWVKLACTLDADKPFKRGAGAMRPSKS